MGLARGQHPAIIEALPMDSYAPPVDRLLTLGEPWEMEEAYDFAKLGIGAEHIPELIRMATDPALLNDAPDAEAGGDVDDALIWAPVHAWRALGHLRAEEAIGPLLDLMCAAEEGGSDIEFDVIPDALALIGPAAMPALTAILADATRRLWVRTAASNALLKMGQQHPEARDECVALIVGQLEAFAANDGELNAFLVTDLIAAREVEAAPLIERAMAAGAVEESVTGNWAWVRHDLGLGPKPAERRYPQMAPLLDALARTGNPGRVEHRKARNQARKKQEKKSRKHGRNHKRGKR